MNLALGAGAILCLLLLWAAQKSKHPFDLRDALIDPATGKASLNALLIAATAALSAWLVVARQLAGKDDVGSILNIVLLTFVGGRVVSQGINAFKPGPDLNTTVERTEKETVTKEPVSGT